MKRQKHTNVVGGKCNTPTTMPSQNRETHAIITRAKRNGFMLHRPKRIDIKELNPHLICVLCGGYYIDATTIIECLHSFCRTCIVRYLESSNVCPICDVIVHKSKPLQNIRPDNTLQDLVYKLVPRLFKDEMKRRRDLYASMSAEEVENHAVPADTEGRGEEVPERVIYSDDENISLSLELSPNGRPPDIGFDPHSSTIDAIDQRFLSCPAAFTVTLIKRFIRMKFTLSDEYQIDIYHTDEPLNDFYTLMDIAYIYLWKRKGPLRLFYTVYCDPAKKRKVTNDNEEEEPMEIVQEIESFPKVDGKSVANEQMNPREFAKAILTRTPPRSEPTVTSSEESFAPAPSVPPAARNPTPIPTPPHVPSPAPKQAPTPAPIPVSIKAPAPTPEPVSTSSPVSASFPVSASSPVSTTAPVSPPAHLRSPPLLPSPLHLTTTTSSTTTVTTSVATTPPTPSPTPIPTITPISTATPITSTTTLTSTPTSTYTQTTIPAPPPTPAPTPKPREPTPPPPPPPTPSLVTEAPTAPQKMTRPQNISIPSTIQVTEPAQKRTPAVTTAPAASLPKITAKPLPQATTTTLTMLAPTPPTPAPTPAPRLTTAPSPVRISSLRPPPPLPHTLATKSDQKGTFMKQRQMSPPQQQSLQKHHQHHQHPLHKQHMPHLQMHKQQHHHSHQQQQPNRQEHQATKPASHFDKNHHHHHHHHHHHQGPDLTKQIPDCRNGEAPDYYPEQTEPLSLKIEMKDRDCCGKHQNNGKPPRIQEKMIPVRNLNGQFSCRGCKTEMHSDNLNNMTSPISNHGAHKFLVTGPIYTPLNLTNGRMDDITPLNLKKEPEKPNSKNRSK